MISRFLTMQQRIVKSGKNREQSVKILVRLLTLSSGVIHQTMACCTALYCTVLYCTVLHCIVLYCICIVLYCTVLYFTVLQVRAVFALGSFLCRSSAVFQGEAAGPMPPLFLSHGSEDAMVRAAWVTHTRDKLAGRASNEGSRRLRSFTIMEKAPTGSLKNL